jgi:uncharacterized protein (DUF983 family)
VCAGHTLNKHLAHMRRHLGYCMDMTPLPVAQPSFTHVMRCGLRLRCPRCGQGHLLQRMFTMNHDCPLCGLKFFREPGYFVGAMIINYGITAAILITAYLLSQYFPEMWHASAELKILVWMVVAIVLSLIFVPFSRGMWLAIDYWMEPWAD